jgi:hypothetical protein
MVVVKFILTLLGIGIAFVGLIYLVTFVMLGIFQAVVGYSARKASDERKQRLIKRSEPVLLLVNSYLYATCVAALTRATVAVRAVGHGWIYVAISFLFLMAISLLPYKERAGDAPQRMRYFLLTFLAASYLFPDLIAPFWNSLWNWWFS